MFRVRFAKTHQDAKTPSYAKPGDNGLDLTAVVYKEMNEGGIAYHDYSTGIAVEIPYGYVGLVCARSSVSQKNLILSNGIGVVDSSYRGTISVRFKRQDSFLAESIYSVGERVCQLVIVPCPTVALEEVPESNLTITDRGVGGYGHSGN